MQKLMFSHVSFADVFSLLNACFGFFSILFALSGEIHFAFSLILLAIVADGLDGIIARKTGMGKLGDYLEAMSDMISLCVAPLVFIYMIYFHQVTLSFFENILFILVFLVFLCFGMIRLSSFHILREKWFIGLPASASAIIIITLCLFEIDILILFFVIIILAIVMISPIRFPKTGLYVNGIATVLIFLSILFGLRFQGLAPIILLSTIMLYAVGGPIYLFVKKE